MVAVVVVEERHHQRAQATGKRSCKNFRPGPCPRAAAITASTLAVVPEATATIHASPKHHQGLEPSLRQKKSSKSPFAAAVEHLQVDKATSLEQAQ